MTLGRTIRDWSAHHRPAIASSDQGGDRPFSTLCPWCQAEILVPLRERLGDWELFPRHPFTPDEQAQIRARYAMGEHSRSPCGGSIHFDRISCPSCARHLLFSYGINEPNNGLLKLTVQGLVEISEK